MFLADVPGALARTNGERERYGAVALRCQSEIKLVTGRNQRGDRVLPHARDDEAAIVSGRPAFALLARGQQAQRVGSQRVIRPGVHVEEVGATGDGGIRQQFVQGRQCSKHDPRQVLCRVTTVEGRQLAHRRIDAAQREHRRVGTVIRRAQLDDARDAFSALATEREPRDEASHAVTHQHDR